jgi:predicted nucleotidyltransferase
MRLEPEQISGVIAAIHESLGKNAEVWLFGSRVDDRAKGGDIDLYVEVADDSFGLDTYLDCRRRLFQIFSEQKVDLLVRPRGRALSPMELMARETGILLNDREDAEDARIVKERTDGPFVDVTLDQL